MNRLKMILALLVGINLGLMFHSAPSVARITDSESVSSIAQSLKEISTTLKNIDRKLK